MPPCRATLSVLLTLVLLGAGCARVGFSSCQNKDCSGHGVCVTDAASGARCECDTGFANDGPLACVAKDDNPCLGVACSEHGTCAIEAQGARCHCAAGFINDGPLACVFDNRECSDASGCDDGNPCTNDLCPAGVCTHESRPDDSDCSADELCADSPKCEAGICVGSPRDCTALDSTCARGACDPADGLCKERAVNENGGCDDGDACTLGDRCNGGACVAGSGRKDSDGDSFVDSTCSGGDDCDDADPAIHPGPTEGPAGDVSCTDGKDNDCDTSTDAADSQCASTVVQLFRSVGVNASDLNDAGRTVEISGSTARFSGALANRVGVGDVVQYSVGGSPALAFVRARHSAAVYTVLNAQGLTPTAAPAGTSASVFRAYAALADWATQSENASIDAAVRDFDSSKNLDAANAVMNVACYADGVDTARVDADGWTTAADNYLRIFTPTQPEEVGISQRHEGRWTDTAYVLAHTDDWCLRLGAQHARIEGLQLDYRMNIQSGQGALRLGPDAAPTVPIDQRVSESIIRVGYLGTNDSWRAFFRYYGSCTAPAGEVRVWNNVVYGLGTSPSSSAIGISCTTAYVYNNTVYNAAFGISGHSTAITHASNNLVQNCTSGYSGAALSGENNVSNLADTPGTSGKTCTAVFVDAANGDFHLAPTDTCAASAGTDLSADTASPFADDIDGEARALPWDAGADQL